MSQDKLDKSNGKIKVSHSELASFTRCRLQHYYSYSERIRAKKTPRSMALGRLVHLALAWYYSQDRDAAEALNYYKLNCQLERDRLESTGVMEPDDWAEVDHVQSMGRIMLEIYFRHQAPTDNWMPLAIEQDLVVPIPVPGGKTVSNRYEYRARLDMLVARGEELIVVDHKTAATRISPDDYARNDQMLRYLWAVSQAHGALVNKVIINALKKPSLKPGRVKGYQVGPRFFRRKTDANASTKVTGEPIMPVDRDETIEEFRERARLDLAARPSHYLQRLELEYDPADIRRAGENIYWITRELHTQHAVYRVPGIHCNWCEYADLCLHDDEATRALYEPKPERTKK